LPTRVPAELASAGDCRLLASQVSTCIPGCPVATEVCDGNARCVPLPRARDLGRVAVYGLVVPLEMTPNAVTKSYTNPAVPELPNPGFLPGADLRVVTAGGDYAAFELRGWGITALDMGSAEVQVSQGQDLSLSWVAPERTGPTRLHVELNVNQHGSTNSWLECDFADTGAASIPAALVDGLIARGLSGFPTLTATQLPGTSISASETPSATLSPTHTITSTPFQEMKVIILGCNTGIDFSHGMGEVTNAYVTLQNTGTLDLPDSCGLLRALDEDREHPDKERCVETLPAGYQVTLKLTVDSAYKVDTVIQVDASSNGQLLIRVDQPSCRDIDIIGPIPGDIGVVKPIPK